MEWTELKLILNQIGVNTEHLYPNGDHVQIPCPLAPWFHKKRTDHHPSLSIKFGEPPTLWKCFSCGEGGKLWSLVDSVATLGERSDLNALADNLTVSDEPSLGTRLASAMSGIDSWSLPTVKTQVRVLQPTVLDNFRFIRPGSDPHRYVVDRVPESRIDEFQLKYDLHKDRVVFPIFNQAHQLLGAVGRTLASDPRKYYNYFGVETGKCLGGADKFTDRPRLFIVEGYFDLLRCWEWAAERDADVACTFKAEISPEQAELILGLDKTVSVWYDNDVAGNRGWDKAEKTIGKYLIGLKRARLPEDKDVGALSERHFKHLVDSLYGEL